MMASVHAANSATVLDYALRWRAQSVYPGSHAGSGGATSGIFRALVPFERAPDIRRLDLRRSMRDPSGKWFVKEYLPRVSVTVCALIDISASMSWTDGAVSKLALGAELCDLLAHSAHRIGDSFGIYACGEDIHDETSLLATRNRAATMEIIEQLTQMRPTDDSAAGLAVAAEYLAGSRKLVFLISDFLFSESQIVDTLALLALHDVIPVVLQDNAIESLPNWGVSEFADLESGQRRFVLLRPALKRRWLERVQQRREHLDSIFRQYANPAFTITDRLDVEALNTYLIER